MASLVATVTRSGVNHWDVLSACRTSYGQIRGHTLGTLSSNGEQRQDVCSVSRFYDSVKQRDQKNELKVIRVQTEKLYATKYLLGFNEL